MNPMIFDEFWSRLQKKNPGLAEGSKLTFSVKELRRIMELSFKEGQRHAEALHKLLGDIFRKAGRG